MTPDELKNGNFDNEFKYSYTRSHGPGGQNINKVNTKVELRFSLLATFLFSEREKEIIYRKLKNKINNERELIIISQSERTQLLNKKIATEKFYELVAKALTIPVKRKSTTPTYSSKIKRLAAKRIRGEIKKMRKESGRSSENNN